MCVCDVKCCLWIQRWPSANTASQRGTPRWSRPTGPWITVTRMAAETTAQVFMANKTFFYMCYYISPLRVFQISVWTEWEKRTGNLGQKQAENETGKVHLSRRTPHTAKLLTWQTYSNKLLALICLVKYRHYGRYLPTQTATNIPTFWMTKCWPLIENS